MSAGPGRLGRTLCLLKVDLRDVHERMKWRAMGAYLRLSLRRATAVISTSSSPKTSVTFQ